MKDEKRRLNRSPFFLFVEFHFAGLDGDGEFVLLRRERTGGKVGVGAGPVLGAVEIEDEFVTDGTRDSHLASGAVGGFTTGEVVEVEAH